VAVDDDASTFDRMSMTAAGSGSAWIITVVGEIDLYTARSLGAACEDSLHHDGVETVVVDLTGVRFLGSSGLGVLADLATRAAARGPSIAVRIVAPAQHRPVVRPWDAMNLHHVLPLHPDVASALAATP
jgi:anti-sigma B factor antagonist